MYPLLKSCKTGNRYPINRISRLEIRGLAPIPTKGLSDRPLETFG